MIKKKKNEVDQQNFMLYDGGSPTNFILYDILSSVKFSWHSSNIGSRLQILFIMFFFLLRAWSWRWELGSDRRG